MKRNGILHPQLSRIIAELGHTDLLVIADAGLPLPLGVERVDLALEAGVPGFFQTLEAILREVDVEALTLASEIKTVAPASDARLRALIPLEPAYLPHADFKTMTHRARAVIRTGEVTPYNNVILQCGVHEGFKR